MNACAASNGGTSEPSTRTWTGGSVATTGSAGASSSSTRTVLRAPLTIPFRLLLPCDSEREAVPHIGGFQCYHREVLAAITTLSLPVVWRLEHFRATATSCPTADRRVELSRSSRDPVCRVPDLRDCRVDLRACAFNLGLADPRSPKPVHGRCGGRQSSMRPSAKVPEAEHGWTHPDRAQPDAPPDRQVDHFDSGAVDTNASDWA